MEIQKPDIDFAYDPLPELHDVLAELRDISPVVRVKFHGEPAWLINGYEALRQAFGDEEHFQAARAYQLHSEPSMGRTMQCMAGDEHRINRALVSKPFFPARVRALVESLIESEANALLDTLVPGEPVDLVRAFIQPFPFQDHHPDAGHTGTR